MAGYSSRVIGAGAFLIVGALLFTAALFMIGERRMLFEDRFTVYTELATLGQLEEGAIVRVAGMTAGEVTKIDVPASPAQKFRVRMEVRDDLQPLIRTDSVATTQTEGLVGAIYVNIAPGSEQSPALPEGGTISGGTTLQLADLMAQASATMADVARTVDILSVEAEKTLKEVSATSAEAHQLMTDITPQIRAIAQNGARISADARNLVAGLQAGEGTMGKLLKDDALYMRAREIAEEAQVVMANVRDVTDEARRAIADFRSEDGPAQGLFADMRVTLSQAREATGDLADNMEALKHNFLLRGFFNRRGYFDLDAISPAQYRNGVLENGKRRAVRTWLDAAVLYETRPNGTLALTEDGRKRLDSAMATYLRYLPANPLVVEGYSTQGTIGEQYRDSRQRAGIVREYLLGRYGLMPQHTGSMALGADAQGSPSGNGWDGVAITLFLDADTGVQFVNADARE
jgi:phospholipid/cholesterol/gamma-HCH transport system substrate-binding protein